MAEKTFDFGMIGLGVMGRNLLLNIADHGFSIAGLDTDEKKVTALKMEAAGKNVDGTTEMKRFISMVKTPRRIMMLVPAGAPVDAVLKEALPLLQNGDVMIDGGNSHFSDTDRRIKQLEPTGIQFMGVGISGGEEGARYGPSIMPGGTVDGYEKMKPIFEAIAAKVNGESCVTHIGPGSAGHYTKMVHNGIEYGFMQVISETYDVMKRGLQMTNEQMLDVYTSWNEGELQSFLLGITARIFSITDDETHEKLLLDHILDSAAQKGTGKWTSQSAMDLQVPTPVIDLAVSMRDLTAMKQERTAASKKLPFTRPELNLNSTLILSSLKDAAYFSLITIYAQGMHLLKAASDKMKYNIVPQHIARIWRGGCIIRSALLEQIMEAYQRNPSLSNLITDDFFSGELLKRREAIQQAIEFAMRRQIPVPALGASLAYVDAYRSEWLPANLIQAQRDFFGSHTYQRTDKEGTFHTKWD
ncbi:MAG TPA: NADP-dependent phosphogluconate dehydrogenase [Chitinophagales bacterium]|nr:NADP-dependent phosphogluconate dehydrogenase [Chitinophagales bacterium]